MRTLLGALILLLFPIFLRAQCTGSSPTWTSTPDQASLQSCVNGASAGDTINVTAGSGSVTWSTNGIQLRGKALSIIGPGAANLTINDAIPTGATGTCQMFYSAPTVVRALTRISGFTLQPAPGTTSVCPAITIQGTCSLSGCPNLRIDHNVFSGWAAVTKNNNGYAINAVGDMFGVFDHNTVNGATNDNTYLDLVQINHAQFMGQGQWGDYSWSQPENYGSANFMFFENNTLNYASCCENEANAGPLETRGGGRIVVRFNTFTGDHLNGPATWHGTESNGRSRGGRTWEFYGNTYTCNSSKYHQCSSVIAARSGTGLTWGNSLNLPDELVSFQNLYTYRVNDSIGGWPVCDGTGPYDTNDGITYYSGTVASYDSSTSTVTVSGTNPGWQTNHWTPAGAPYSMHDVTKTTSTNAYGAEISGNGSNTLTLRSGWKPWTPAAGDSIQILRATVCMDQAGGRGAGILYSGFNNVGLTSASPVAPANQVLSPSYLWANPFSGGKAPLAYVGTNTGRIIANRNWYQDNINQTAQTSLTSPFDGSSGTGYGTLADRPSTCTAGTAYWQTDWTTTQWNTTNTAIPGISGSTQGALFVCTSSGTWPPSPTYVPYPYPHPLITGGSISTAGNPPNPPTGLAATVQ